MGTQGTSKRWRLLISKVKTLNHFVETAGSISLVCAVICAAAVGVRAQVPTARPQLLRDVGIDQKLGDQIPLNLPFRDSSGKTVILGDYFGKKPVILSLVYYNCPMLCTLSLNGLLHAMRAINFTAGDEYNVVTVSFDPREKPELAAAKRRTYLGLYGRSAAINGWHFLTGDEDSIEKLTKAVGFRYVYDTTSGQFAHATGLMVLTPQGKLSRYFYGIEYSPPDLRLSLVEASGERIGSPVDEVLLFCCAYNPATGKYGLIISRVIALSGLGTILILGTVVLVLLRGERRKKRSLSQEQQPVAQFK